MNTEDVETKSRRPVEQCTILTQVLDIIHWYILTTVLKSMHLVISWLTFDLKEFKLFCRHTQKSTTSTFISTCPRHSQGTPAFKQVL